MTGVADAVLSGGAVDDVRCTYVYYADMTGAAADKRAASAGLMERDGSADDRP